MGRPELRHADDDGAKYYDLFQSLGEQNQIELLTEFDPDTLQLFPQLAPIAKPPTQANVERDRFTTRLARSRTPAERAHVLFDVEKAMQERADAAKERRGWLRLGLGLGIGSATTFLVQSELDQDKTVQQHNQDRGLFAFGALLIGTAFTSTLFRDPVERMVDLWKADPSHPTDQAASHPSLQLGVVPAPGGGTVGLSGSF